MGEGRGGGGAQIWTASGSEFIIKVCSLMVGAEMTQCTLKAVDDLQCTRRREVTINQMSFWNSPAAAQLFKFWPDSPNLECQVHGLATANLQLNREDRLFYNNWTSKRTSLLNYMF